MISEMINDVSMKRQKYKKYKMLPKASLLFHNFTLARAEPDPTSSESATKAAQIRDADVTRLKDLDGRGGQSDGEAALVVPCVARGGFGRGRCQAQEKLAEKQSEEWGASDVWYIKA